MYIFINNYYNYIFYIFPIKSYENHWLEKCVQQTRTHLLVYLQVTTKKKEKKEEEEEEALKFLIWSACMNSQSLSTQENGQTLLSGPTKFGTNLSTKLKIRPKLINPNEYDPAAPLFNFA